MLLRMLPLIVMCAVAVPAPAATPAPSALSAEAEIIRRAQQLLMDIGQYSGPVDGKPSAATTAAIKRFQAMRGIEVDGKADRLLLNMLEDAKKPGYD